MHSRRIRFLEHERCRADHRRCATQVLAFPIVEPARGEHLSTTKEARLGRLVRPEVGEQAVGKAETKGRPHAVRQDQFPFWCNHCDSILRVEHSIVSCISCSYVSSSLYPYLLYLKKNRHPLVTILSMPFNRFHLPLKPSS